MGKRKRVGQLTTEEKLQLASNAGRLKEEGVSLNKIARQESRKGGQKALANIVNPTVSEPVVESNIPTDDPIKGPVKYEPTVVSTTIAKENPPGSRNYSMESGQVEVPYGLDKIAENTAIAQERNKLQLAQTNEESTLNSQTAQQNAAQGTNPVIAQATQPVVDQATGEVVQNMDAENARTWTNPVIAGLTSDPQMNPNNEFTTTDVSSGTTDDKVDYRYGDDEYDRKVANRNAFISNQRTSEPAIERLGVTDYYPDINQGIRVGGYSGSIVGSNDIYVAQGGILPMGVLDARKRALEKAAVDKAKYKEKLFEMATVQGAYPYQKQLDAEIMDYNTKFGEAVGYNWDKLAPGSSKQAMEYWTGVKKRQTLGRATQEIHTKVDTLFKAMTSEGKEHVSKEQEALAAKWMMGDFKMDEILKDPKKEKEFYAFANKLKAYDNATHYAREAATVMQKSMDKVPLNIKAGLDMNDKKIAKSFEDLYKAKASRDYDLLAKAMLTFVDDDRIDAAARGLVDQHRFDIGGDYEEQVDYMKRQLLSNLGEQVDITDRIANNNNLGWARLSHDKQQAIKAQPYTELHNIGNSPVTKTNIQAIYGNPNLTKAQKTKQGIDALQNVIGGKLIRSEDGNNKFEFQLPFKAEKGKEYKFTTGQLFSQEAMDRIAKGESKKDKDGNVVFTAPSDEIKNALQNKDAVWGADIVNRKAQYYVTRENGQVVPVTEADLIAYPELASRMTIYAKNEYNPYLLVTNKDGKTNKVYTGHTANIIDDLNNPNARYEYDADVKENIPTMNTDWKMGTGTIASPFNADGGETTTTVATGSLNAPK